MATPAEGQYGGIDAHPAVAHGSAHIHTDLLPMTGADLLVFVIGATIVIVVGFYLRRSA